MDRETVETGFELCANGEPCIGEKFMKCPFSPRNNAEQNCSVTMARNALALQKMQGGAVEPKQVDLYGKDDWYGLVCICPDCKAEWMSDKDDTHFCPKCGQAVKWE